MVGLCALQAVALWPLLSGPRRLALAAELLCPLAVLTLCVSRMAFDGTTAWFSALRPLEAAFLVINLTAAVVAAGLLLAAGAAAEEARGAAAWAVWCVNTASCAAMVYLAFFFRLF